MHKWREKHPDHPNYVKAAAKKTSTYGELTDTNADLVESADDIYAKHREGVIAKDKAAKARRKAGGKRG